MQSESMLKQAVEEQLDLILKIEEERKLLKKQNKMLKEEHQKMIKNLKKYSVEKVEAETNTIQSSQSQIKEEVKIMKEIGSQIDIDTNQVNNSKLSSAQELLKQLNISTNLCSKCEDRITNVVGSQQISQKRRSPPKNQQISNQIVKMSKEIALLKKQLKDADSRSKLRQKEIKDLKKCLEVKSEALDKSRKDFNELSQVFNGDKFKSVRALQGQANQLRARNMVLQQQVKSSSQLKQMLAEITQQYQQYRQDRENRIEKLLTQLKEKDSRCEQLSRQYEKSFSYSDKLA